MGPVGRHAFFSLLALILVPAVPSRYATASTQGGETWSLLLTAPAPAERLSPPVTWVDELDRQLTTYLTKKYPAYNFAPYSQELSRIRNAISVGDRWGAKREMGVFLQMLASRAYGLGDDAAEELAGLSQQIMPDEEFGIIYPGCGSQAVDGRESRETS